MADLNFKVIVLDFDGVIVESIGIKDWAFEQLFKGHPGELEEIMAYHRSHNATIRFEKFRHIVQRILKKTYSLKLEKELSIKFSALVFKRIVQCPFVEGAEEFLSYYYKRMPIYLSSINPPKELNKIIEARHLKKYFKRVYPYLWKKKDALQDVRRREKVLAKEIVFVGDSPEDLKAAQAAKVRFVARMSDKSFGKSHIPIFRNLREIKTYLGGVKV